MLVSAGNYENSIALVDQPYRRSEVFVLMYMCL